MGLTEVSGTFWVWPREFVFSRKVLSRGQTRPRSSHPPPSRHMTFINKIALLFSAESGTITLIKTRPLWIDCHLRGGEEDAEARGQDWREQRKAGRAEGGLRPPASLPGQGRTGAGRTERAPLVGPAWADPLRTEPAPREASEVTGRPCSPRGARQGGQRPPSGRRRARPHPRALLLTSPPCSAHQSPLQSPASCSLLRSYLDVLAWTRPWSAPPATSTCSCYTRVDPSLQLRP